MIISPLTATAFTNERFNYIIQSTNNPNYFTATTLPIGLFLDRNTGYITGIPIVDGNYNITISAVGSLSTDAASLYIRINHNLISSPITAQYFGYNAPFFGGKEAIFSRQTDIKLIKNDLLQLLLTSPGERLYRPDFGSNIRSFLFEQITNIAISNLEANILAAIAKYEPRVRATSVTVNTDVDNNIVIIKVFGTMVNNDSTVQNSDANLLVSLNLPLSQSSQIG